MPVRTRRDRAARRIQRAYRGRYFGVVLNWRDADPITRLPLHTVPRRKLFLLHTRGLSLPHGFDAVPLLDWLLRTPVHPLTRDRVSVDTICALYRHVHLLAQANSQMSPSCEEALRRGRIPVTMEETRVVTSTGTGEAADEESVQWTMRVSMSPLYFLNRLTMTITRDGATGTYQTTMHYEVQNTSGLPDLAMVLPPELTSAEPDHAAAATEAPPAAET